MSRYYTRPSHHIRHMAKMVGAPCAAWDDSNPMLPPITVDDHVPVWTGLVDHRGDPILRAPNSIGFGR